MSSPALDAILVEIDQRQAVLEPELEGLRDYARLNLHPDTLVEVNFSISTYERRLSFLAQAETALINLQTDGHPEMPIRDVTDAVLADLNANALTIQAALIKFGSNQAIGLSAAPGLPAPKAAKT